MPNHRLNIIATAADKTVEALKNVLGDYLELLLAWIFTAEKSIVEQLRTEIVEAIPKPKLKKYDKGFRLGVVNTLITFILDLFLQPIFLLRVIASVFMGGPLIDLVVIINVLLSLVIAMIPAFLYAAAHVYFISQTGLNILINLIF